MSGFEWTPGEQALLDQSAALLRDHVARIRRHWAAGDCEFGGAGPAACLGQHLAEEIMGLSEHNAKVMYMEALIKMARVDGEGDGRQAPGVG